MKEWFHSQWKPARNWWASSLAAEQRNVLGVVFDILITSGLPLICEVTDGCRR
jgi:hypothetical protein